MNLEKSKKENRLSKNETELIKKLSPKVNIYNNSKNEDLTFIVDLPGVKKGNVNIEISENNELKITSHSSFKEFSNVVYKQFNIGDFDRVFKLPKEYDNEKVKANFENGSLELIIPKREEYKIKKVSISL